MPAEWHDVAELRPEMSPVFVIAPSWLSWQVAYYLPGKGWYVCFGVWRAALLHREGMKFIRCVDCVPPVQWKE